MARVTATEVKAIMDNCTVADATVDTFILSGNLIISKVFVNDTTLGDDLLKEIERWFVAHMLASTICRTTESEKLGDASVKYTGKWDKNLDSTPYGQMAKQLDITGLLANTGKKGASMYAVTSFD